jgi:hypothetical protein
MRKESVSKRQKSESFFSRYILLTSHSSQVKHLHAHIP